VPFNVLLVLRLRILLGERFAMLVGVGGVLMRLLAQLVRGQMIAFAVSGRGGGVGVGGQVVQLRDSIVCALWHNALLFPNLMFRKMRALHTGAAPHNRTS
jgi:hypothetical protein